MFNGIILVLVVQCIYASLACDLFGDLYCGDRYSDFPDDLRFTSRGSCFGSEYYGNFLLSFYTMFQIITGESWSEAAVRPVTHFYCNEGSLFECFGVCGFFISFICVTSIVLLNVFAVCLVDAYAEGAIEDDGTNGTQNMSNGTAKVETPPEDTDAALVEEVQQYRERALDSVRSLSGAVERMDKTFEIWSQRSAM